MRTRPLPAQGSRQVDMIDCRTASSNNYSGCQSLSADGGPTKPPFGPDNRGGFVHRCIVLWDLYERVLFSTVCATRTMHEAIQLARTGSSWPIISCHGLGLPSCPDRLSSQVHDMRCRHRDIGGFLFGYNLLCDPTIRLISRSKSLLLPSVLGTWLPLFCDTLIFSTSRGNRGYAFGIHRCPPLGCRDRPMVIPSRLADCNLFVHLVH